MADPLPAADHITAVIKLTGSLISAVCEYLWGVDEAPDDLRKLADELQSLGKVLASLRNDSPTDKEFRSSVLQKLNARNGPLFECAVELKRLQFKMNSDKSLGGDIKGLGWLLDKNQILPYILRIEKHKKVLALALQLMRDQSKFSEVMEGYIQDVGDGKDSLRSGLSIRNPQIWAAQVAEKRKECLDWLYKGDFESRYLGIQERRLKGTGEWLLQSPIFQNWMKGKPGFLLLWGRAIAGAGKTYISSKAIDHIRSQAQTQNYAVAYVFFDYMERDRQRPIDVLSCLIKQLACQTRSFSSVSRTLSSRLKDQQVEANFEKLTWNLIETSKSFDRVFLVFDGLDECDKTRQRKDLLPLFHTLAKDNISVFLTSRVRPGDIQRSLRMVAKIDLSAKAEDIKIYIEQRIDSNPRAKRLLGQGKCRDKFITELTACANGMFLFIHLLMGSLGQQPTVKHVFEELRLLEYLSGEKDCYLSMYDHVIDNIRDQDISCATMALKILSWLVKAQRTLTVDELREAISVEADRYELEEWDLPDKEALLDVCAGLVTIDENNNTVRLIHHTARECLLKGHMLPSDADYQVAMACITYLSFNVFSQSVCRWSREPGQSFEDRLKAHPFLKYAAEYLSAHINACDLSLTTEAFLRFTKSPGQLFSYLQVFGSYTRGDVLPLHVSALVGHLPVVRLLVGEGRDRLSRDHNQRTVLHQAVNGNHREIVQFLLEDGRVSPHVAHPWEVTEISAQDEEGKTALHWAARKGFTDIVKLLLENGADISGYGKGGQTALHEAARGGHEEVVKLLLENGAPAWSTEECGQTALHVAAEEGHRGIVERLLQHHDDMEPQPHRLIEERGHGNLVVKRHVDPRVGVSALDHELHTPLHLAAWGSHVGIVRLLLQEGAEVSDRDTSGETVLHLATCGGNKSIVQLLLQNGADVSVKSHGQMTALDWAATRGYTDIVQILLDNGADISARLGGWTALELSLAHGHEQAAQLLLESDSETPTPGEINTTLAEAARKGDSGIVELLLNHGANILGAALYNAAAEGHRDVVKLLLDGGADILLQHKDRQTVLHVAAYNGHQDVVKLLLENGADIQAREDNQQTALHKAAYGSERKGNEEIVHLLVEAGADISAQDKRGQTALILASNGGPREVAQILIANGADIPGHDMNGQTALHNAAYGGHAAIVKLLLNHGAHSSVRNQSHQTALLLAASRGEKEVVELLLQDRADISESNEDGQTAFFLAAVNGHNEVVRLLIKSGADISENNGDGQTAFFLAAMNGHNEVVRLLIKSGADISENNGDGQTAFFLAAVNGHNEVARLLIESGADITERDKDCRTAFILAAEKGYSEVVQLMLKKGADISEKNGEGQTALFIAAQNGYGGVLQVLIKAGVDVSEKNGDSETALFVATRRGHLQIVHLLLENGADISETNADGQTALFLAGWHRNVFELLIDKGANRWVQDRHGKIAILEDDEYDDDGWCQEPWYPHGW